MTTYFYPSQTPAIGDIVIAVVKTISDVAVYCSLPAYGGREAMIPTSEMNIKRYKSVNDYARVGQQMAAQVLRVEGEAIDLSTAQVREAEGKEAMNQFHRDRAVDLILRTAAGQDPAKTEALYREIVWPRLLAVTTEGTEIPLKSDIYELFEEVRACEEGAPLPISLPEELVTAIRKKMPESHYTAEREIFLRFGPYADGVQRLNAELQRLAQIEGLQVFVVAPPKFKIVATDKTKARAEARVAAVTVPAIC